MNTRKNVKELRYYGVNACRAIWELRRDEIVRVYLVETRKREFGSMLKWCAQTKRAYRFVTNEQMEKITASTHHEGICIQAVKRDALQFEDFGRSEFQDLDGVIIFLDGIENPHNLGSILRVAAHFDVSLVLGQKGRIPTLSSATCRVAEGGAEFVSVAETRDGGKALETLRKKGYRILSTSNTGDKAIYNYKLPKKVVTIFGAERSGVSAPLSALADDSIHIPGSGAVESLNVAAACAVTLSEYSRQQWKK